ncbi:MAG: hypothetical protein AAFW68_09785 [Pseudomonadota bacterium]
MKVLVFAAAGAVLFGVSKIDVTIAPDIHAGAQRCNESLSDAENPVTVLGAFACELQALMPYDSLSCLISNTRLSWNRPNDNAPEGQAVDNEESETDTSV